MWLLFEGDYYSGYSFYLNKYYIHKHTIMHLWLYHILCGDGAGLVSGESRASRAAVIPVSTVPPVRHNMHNTSMD